MLEVAGQEVLDAVLGVAGTATAAGPGVAEPPEPPPGFELSGTHGYKIAVSPYVDTTGREAIALVASRGKESVAYVAAARLTEELLDVKEISLRNLNNYERLREALEEITKFHWHDSQTGEVTDSAWSKIAREALRGAEGGDVQ